MLLLGRQQGKVRIKDWPESLNRGSSRQKVSHIMNRIEDGVAKDLQRFRQSVVLMFEWTALARRGGKSMYRYGVAAVAPYIYRRAVHV